NRGVGCKSGRSLHRCHDRATARSLLRLGCTTAMRCGSSCDAMIALTGRWSEACTASGERWAPNASRAWRGRTQTRSRAKSVERGARLVAGPGVVVHAHLQDLAPGEEGVADVAPVPDVRRPRDRLHPGHSRQALEVVHLLQADGVAAQLLDHRRHALGVALAV